MKTQRRRHYGHVTKPSSCRLTKSCLLTHVCKVSRSWQCATQAIVKVGHWQCKIRDYVLHVGATANSVAARETALLVWALSSRVFLRFDNKHSHTESLCKGKYSCNTTRSLLCKQQIGQSLEIKVHVS